MLLLHGGPGATHEQWESIKEHFVPAGIEFYYYDQLGSYFSDQPQEPALWTLERFVDEVEQVRQALGLGPDNFYLVGQSWGGMLAIEYALKYQQYLKGLVISNMMASIPDYNRYAADVLMADMDPRVLEELKAFEAAEDYHNERYVQLLIEHHYVDHILRMPADQWPDAINRTFAHINQDVYIPPAGPQRVGCQRITRRLGSHRRPAPDHCTHLGNRSYARHDGPITYEVDGRTTSERTFFALPKRLTPVPMG